MQSQATSGEIVMDSGCPAIVSEAGHVYRAMFVEIRSDSALGGTGLQFR